MASNATIVDLLDQRLAEVEAEIEASDYWQTLSDAGTDPETVHAIMREVMLEVWSYQKRVDEAVFTAVGRVGTTIPEQGLIRSMIAVQIEETGHGTMALLDHIALGGDEAAARSWRPSPPSAALIAVVRYLGEREHPLCHLGFMYFFEKLTTSMTEKIAPILRRAAYPEDRLEFMRLHAEEDVRHANMLANVIVECAERYPGATEHILHGFDVFRVVYPHQIWRHAMQRALEGRSCLA